MSVQTTKGRRKPINFGPQGTGKNVFFRNTRMAARSQRKSCGWKSSRTWRLTRELFSWTLFRAAEASGTGQSQCFHTLPERPKLRDLLENYNYKDPVQKTYWWSRTSCRKIWWLEYSRSQNSWWKMWISKQSSKCCGGAGLGYSMDSILSVWNKNFAGNWKEKVLGAKLETKSHLHWQFPEKLAKPVKIFRGIIVRQPLTVQNKWDSRESSTQNKRRDICDIVAVMSGWKLVGGFHGMSLLSAKYARRIVWWKGTIWKAFWWTI